MKLIQFHLPNLGKRIGIVTRESEGDWMLRVTSHQVY